MPEGRTGPEKSGPLLTPRGKGARPKGGTGPALAVIWVGRAIWTQPRPLLRLDDTAWEDAPPGTTSEDIWRRKGRPRRALGVSRVFRRRTRPRLPRRDLVEGDAPVARPGALEPDTTPPTVADRLASLKTAASGPSRPCRSPLGSGGPSERRKGGSGKAEKKQAAVRQAAARGPHQSRRQLSGSS